MGVDGVSACDYIYEADEKTKNHCEFVKGKSYVYQNNLNILPVFPKVSLSYFKFKKVIVQTFSGDGNGSLGFKRPSN